MLRKSFVFSAADHSFLFLAVGNKSIQAYALEYIELNKAGWSNEKHQTQWVNTLATYAFPTIGNLPVNKISTDQIIQLLKPIWIEKNETAKRVQTRIAKILDSAKARGLRTDENPARWQGHLDTLLPKPSSIQKETHHPAMPYKELPAFWRKISSSQSVSSYALRLLILTACRTSEALQAKWDEFDFEENLWVFLHHTNINKLFKPYKQIDAYWAKCSQTIDRHSIQCIYGRI